MNKDMIKELNKLEGDELCQFCVFVDNCPGLISSSKGEPIFPACVDGPCDTFINAEAFKEYLEKEGVK